MANPARICVFCGSSPGRREAYSAAAQTLGTEIARRGLGLVYGGASVGLMGRLADAALAAGGEVIGVLPRALAEVEIGHPGLSELHIVGSMHERKALMAELSGSFAVLPGGIGTLEEAFEVWTWSQLGLHAKPIGLLNVDGFFDPLERFLDSLVEEAFVKPTHRGIMISHPDASRLIDDLLTIDVPVEKKWIGRAEL